MQGVGEVQPLPVQIESILDLLPSLDGDVRHAKKVLTGVTEGRGWKPVEAAHDPLQFKDDRHRHEDGGPVEHQPTGARPLPDGFRVVGVVTVEAREDVGIDGDHDRRRLAGPTTAAASNSDRRLDRPLDGTVTRP